MNRPYKGLLLDLSGVLYEGSRTIPGAVNMVKRARAQGFILRFVTNTASRTHQDALQGLWSMGFEVDPEELFTAPMAARQYIEQQRLRPFCLIHEAIKGEFEALDQQNPNCVLLGDARDDLTYRNLNQAFRLCLQGAPLIGIGRNKYFKDDEGLMLDAGAFIHAIEWTTDTQAIIMGKPSPAFFHQVVASTGLAPEDCMMVGDDVTADVAGAIAAGLQGCLVKTGKYRSKDLELLPTHARVIDSIAELSGIWG